MRADGTLTELERPECSACALHACSDRVEEASGPLVGWRFATASMGLFLVPILLAITGSLLAGVEHDRQLLGGTAGWLLGLGGAIVAGRSWQGDRGRAGGRAKTTRSLLE